MAVTTDLVYILLLNLIGMKLNAFSNIGKKRKGQLHIKFLPHWNNYKKSRSVL